ncbi:MAG: DNA translocase FtsK, partial [Muribaculaceae bacterium]|nr:DNA translocase FtsK [Muribaculaceae bacterium]
AVIPDDQFSDEPVITEMKKVEATLNALCIEMDDRYTLLKNAQTRNIEEYNAKIKEGKLNPAEGHRFLPYIVVIVDEFGDLVMVAGKNVETPIARLAQKARAVGMHVIIATQRPSTNVITGIIKANFPARMSFKVSSGVDSKTILDATGAQHLIGRGDMLIFHNSDMVRVQCAFIDTPEVEAICDYVSRQPNAPGVYLLPEPPMGGEEGAGAAGGGPVGDRDPLFEEAARKVVSANTASTSSLQRIYSIGYNRAGKIMDQMEAAGIVGPSQGGKPRAVLVDMIGLENILSSL